MPSSSGLKRLKVSDETALDTERLEEILEAFSALEYLDATWKFSYMIEREIKWSPDTQWAALGAAPVSYTHLTLPTIYSV